MNLNNFFRKFVPFIILSCLLILLGWELFYAKPNELPSALIGEEVPRFRLPNLFPSQPDFTQQSLTGRVSLVNVWATWCYACGLEQDMLMKIKNEYHVPIYGIDYKDNTPEALTWLDRNGNPYVLIGRDTKGDVAIDFGVYGTPETFVIDKRGKIIYRHIGIIDQKVWDETLYPLIKKNGG
ncbi:Thiol:disulfide interchange protein DsbE [Aquicella siphonis]|uniref:Thiol:disulfide interchange protein DsbE n=1 Tax=Aquicella siphonis TaxID=254247 RepID=A0A5E4PDA1_9COXI|nr:DsbE family thiol:disulfide interchange protein [Aquicella siphonis]VVC74870.1 Thiol:disulfide interchange protein DsbE [Aquicella siphonis]